MRVISLLVPVRCGVYQYHCNLARGLANFGCSVTWLCSGLSNARNIAADGADPTDGEVVASETGDLGERTRALVERIVKSAPDAVICHARGDPVDLNAVRYLPTSVRRILVPHGSSLAVYRAARSVRDHVHATVAISPRIQQDLRSYGFVKEDISLIPTGIDTTIYDEGAVIGSSDGRLRILSHGRIDRNKGIFWLPEILVELDQNRKNWECTISGDGPDLAELRNRIERSGISERVHFVGWTKPEDVPALMKRHDVFLFPTKYEGSPIALLEAMASGCLPVVSRLPGITDWMVRDCENGLLFGIGNVRQATEHLIGLMDDRHRLDEMRMRARESVSRHGLDQMAELYLRLMKDILFHSKKVRSPEALNRCELSSDLEAAWWFWLPDPVKSYLRVVRENIRGATRAG